MSKDTTISSAGECDASEVIEHRQHITNIKHRVSVQWSKMRARYVQMVFGAGIGFDASNGATAMSRNGGLSNE